MAARIAGRCGDGPRCVGAGGTGAGALRRTLADPQVLEKLRQMSLEPAPTTLEEATQEVADAQQFWKAQLAAGKR